MVRIATPAPARAFIMPTSEHGALKHGILLFRRRLNKGLPPRPILYPRRGTAIILCLFAPNLRQGALYISF